MVTRVQAWANPAERWARAFTIEGHGVDGDLIVYCTETPTNAASMTGFVFRTWPDKESWPSAIREEIPPLGGMGGAQSFSIDLVDIDNTLTAEFAVDSAPTAVLDGDHTAGASVFAVKDDTGISDGDHLWIGAEVVKVTSAPIANAFPVDRGQYGTGALPHKDNDILKSKMNSIEGRLLTVYLFPVEGDDMSADTYWELGRFRIDTIAMVPGSGEGAGGLSCWRIAAKSDMRMLTRQVASRRFKGTTFLAGQSDDLVLTFEPWVSATIRDPWTENEIWIKVDKSIFLVDTSGTPRIKGLRQLGSPINTTSLRNPPVEFFQVFGADRSGPSPFRYSRTNLTTRTSAWEKVDHPIDLLLCLLTSSAHADDALELANGHATYGNWSGLPVGLGCGIPIENIDLPSFLAFRYDTSWLAMPNFVVGDKTIEFGELINEQILIPLGAHLSKPADKIVFRRPRLPLVSETVTAWGLTSEILSREVAPGRRQPMFGPPDRSKRILFTSVSYDVPRKIGEGRTTVTYNASEIDGFSVQRAHHGNTDRTLKISMDTVTDEDTDMLARLATRTLFRTKQPLWDSPASTGYDQGARTGGDMVALTHPDMPNTADGTRGWTSVPLELITREVHLEPGENGPRIDWQTLGFGPGAKFGLIAPSAAIKSSTGPDGSGNYTLTVYGNLYTDINAVTTTPVLPTSDAESFTSGDIVLLRNPDGSTPAGSTATVVSVTSTTIVVDGNFGGALADDLIVEYTTHATAAGQQTTNYVYWATNTTSPPDIQSSGEAPWKWGE